MDLVAFTSLLFLLRFTGCCGEPGVLPEGPVDAAVGKNVTLETLLRDPEYVFIIWNFSNGPEQSHIAVLRRTGLTADAALTVDAAHRGRAWVNPGSGGLTLGPLRLEDGGDYSIKILSADGSIRAATTRLRVLEPISCVTVTGPTATLIAGNSTANLSCQAAAGAARTRTWLKDGKPLAASSRLVFSGDMSSMAINPLQKDDNGEYTCELRNPVSTDTASYTMVVNYGPEPARVTGQGAVEANSPLTLTCSAASAPPAAFTWRFNGVITRVRAAQYTIERAALRNSGTYTCEAYNAVTGETTACEHALSVTVYFASLVVCVAAIVLLSAGYLLLLLRWTKNKKSGLNSGGKSDGTDVELSVSHEPRAPAPTCEDPAYQSLGPGSRDQDRLYSTLTNTQL